MRYDIDISFLELDTARAPIETTVPTHNET